jgi:hypothetical protein
VKLRSLTQSKAWWRLQVILYRGGVIGCPECHNRRYHKYSCDYTLRECDGRNWRF